nr:PDZ domain-containing protein [Muribaculaceae bacterium]
MKRKNIAAVLLPLALALGVVGGIFIGRYITVSPLTPAEKKLHEILGIIRNEYVDQLDIDSLLEANLPHILESLDPHSTYIPASELQEVNSQLDSSFSGVGVTFQIVSDSVRVMEVVPGGPAERVGVLPGDRIISGNGKVLTGPEVTSDSVFH